MSKEELREKEKYYRDKLNYAKVKTPKMVKAWERNLAMIRKELYGHS